MEINIFDVSCCSQSGIAEMPPELEKHTTTDDKIQFRWINILDEPSPLPQDVMKTLLDFGKRAIPIICIDGRVVMRGRVPLSEEWIELIKNLKVDEEAHRYWPENMIRSVTHQLLKPENLDYNMVTAQCCSTTYFCACSST